jgi:hypothetical protein
MPTTITKKFYGEGAVLIDPSSVVLEDFTATFGVKRLDTDGVVVAAGTAMTRESTGVYSYDITDPAPNLKYEYWVKFVVGGDTFYSGAEIDGYEQLPGYTLKEMIDELGIMLNELNQAGDEPFEYTPAMGVSLLNRAQDQVMTLVPAAYFTGLHVVDESVTLGATDKEFDLTQLDHDVFHTPKGLMGVRVNSEYFARLISFQEFLELKHHNITIAETEPICYVRGNFVYVEPTTTSSTADVYYLRAPVEMELDSTGDHDEDVSCELPREVQDVILDMAASRGYKIGKDFNRAALSYDAAMVGIEAITGRMKSTDSITAAYLRNLGTPPFGHGIGFDLMRGPL